MRLTIRADEVHEIEDERRAGLKAIQTSWNAKWNAYKAFGRQWVKWPPGRSGRWSDRCHRSCWHEAEGEALTFGNTQPTFSVIVGIMHHELGGTSFESWAW